MSLFLFLKNALQFKLLIRYSKEHSQMSKSSPSMISQLFPVTFETPFVARIKHTFAGQYPISKPSSFARNSFRLGFRL